MFDAFDAPVSYLTHEMSLLSFHSTHSTTTSDAHLEERHYYKSSSRTCLRLVAGFKIPLRLYTYMLH